jgi:hypothetical protein
MALDECLLCEWMMERLVLIPGQHWESFTRTCHHICIPKIGSIKIKHFWRKTEKWVFLPGLFYHSLKTKATKQNKRDQSWWYTPIIPAMWEAQMGGLQLRPAQAKKKRKSKQDPVWKTSQGWWHMPANPGYGGAEVERSVWGCVQAKTQDPSKKKLKQKAAGVRLDFKPQNCQSEK